MSILRRHPSEGVRDVRVRAVGRATHSGRATTTKIWAGIAIHATKLLGELILLYVFATSAVNVTSTRTSSCTRC